MNEFRTVLLRLPDPLEGHGVVFRYVAAFHQNRLAMLHVDPVIGHRPPTERCPQTGDRGAVSKSSLMLDKRHTQQACGFLKQVALFICILGATHKRDCVRPVNRNFDIT